MALEIAERAGLAVTVLRGHMAMMAAGPMDWAEEMETSRSRARLTRHFRVAGIWRLGGPAGAPPRVLRGRGRWAGPRAWLRGRARRTQSTCRNL